jgi:hypothetical protein
VTESAAGSPTLASQMQAVIGATGEFLGTRGTADAEPVLAVVRSYYEASDLFAAQASTAVVAEDGADTFSPTGARAQLFWGAVSDLVVFRCIGLVDCWAALNESSAVTPGVDPAQFSDALSADLRQARGSGEVIESFLPTAAGGASTYTVGGGAENDLGGFVLGTIDKIADDSTKHVLSATLGALGGFIPSGTPTKAVRVLRHVGRVVRLDKLLDWAQRILDLALIKLRLVFGTGFDAIVEPVKSLIEKIVGMREKMAESMFRLKDLRAECESAIATIEAPGVASTKKTNSWNELTALKTRFDHWSLGVDIADTSLEWGWRISVVSPPVTIALTAAKGVLAAGAFLIGRYHLDSPELEFLPWDTHGVLSVLQDNAPAPKQGGAAFKGDDGF